MHQSESSNSSSENGPESSSVVERQSESSISLSSIGWDKARVDEFKSLAGPEIEPGRVARVDGPTVLLITEDGTTRAGSSSQLLINAEAAEDLPATGDWVGFTRRPSHEADVIEFILPRRSNLTRTRQVMRSAVERQVIATNLDVVFVVHAANNVNIQRLEREATQVAASGAEVVIVLNKVDLSEEIDALLDEVKIAVPMIPVYAVSGVTGEGVDALGAYAKPDRTLAFIGASGVGKSTLTNRLLGREVMDTGEVREDDQRGRHTTTARHLIPLPEGGALIDTPGMRSLGLSDAEEGVETVFEDIIELALKCRFTDCSHSGDPGCAIQDAISNGELTNDRLAAYGKLSRELEFVQSKSDVGLRNAKRDVWKARSKRIRQIVKSNRKPGRSQ